MVIFGALGCAGAALFGRIEDFIEYYAFTNKVDGLPNRAKCDQFIASRDGRPLGAAALQLQLVTPVLGLLLQGHAGLEQGRLRLLCA